MRTPNTWRKRWNTPSGPGRSGRILQHPTSRHFGGGTQVAKTIAANVFPDGNQWCKYCCRICPLGSNAVDDETLVPGNLLLAQIYSWTTQALSAGAKLPVSVKIVMWAKFICQNSNALICWTIQLFFGYLLAVTKVMHGWRNIWIVFVGKCVYARLSLNIARFSNVVLYVCISCLWTLLETAGVLQGLLNNLASTMDTVDTCENLYLTTAGASEQPTVQSYNKQMLDLDIPWSFPNLSIGLKMNAQSIWMQRNLASILAIVLKPCAICRWLTITWHLQRSTWWNGNGTW